MADFKLKVKSFAFKFTTIETTSGSEEFELQGLMAHTVENVLRLLPTEQERRAIVRKVINE